MKRSYFQNFIWLYQTMTKIQIKCRNNYSTNDSKFSAMYETFEFGVTSRSISLKHGSIYM
jgi:hypothetical protein